MTQANTLKYSRRTRLYDGPADLACDAPIPQQLLRSGKLNDVITDVMKSGSAIREEHLDPPGRGPSC